MRLVLPALALALTACGTKTGTDDDAGTGSETATASSTASVDESGAAACEQYQPTPEIGPAVTISIRHDGTAPVYFAPHGCGGAITVAITDASGQSVPYLLDGECFPNTCDGFVGAAPNPRCRCSPPTASTRSTPSTVTSAWCPGSSTTSTSGSRRVWLARRASWRHGRLLGLAAAYGSNTSSMVCAVSTRST